MSGLQGKSVIVTGSSSGIGEATALLFAKNGASVVLCGRDCDRLQEALQRCKTEAASAGHTDSRFISVLGDLNDSVLRTKLVEDAVENFGKIDILIYNHAIAVAGDSLETLTEEDFDTTMHTNVKSGIFLIQKALPHLEKSRGSIVCVSSIARHCCTKQGLFSYSFSKAALEHAVRSMALDLGPKGIRVNCVNPTFIRTRIFRHMFPEPAQLDAFERMYVESTPLQGVATTPQNPAEAIVFLASDEAKLISGGSIVIDGALLCKGNPPNYS